MTTLRPVGMSARRTAIIGGLMVATGPLSLTLYAPALPTLVEDLGTTDAGGKLTLSVYFAAFALAQLICGPLSDRYGRRGVGLVFFAVYVLGCLLCTIAPTLEWLFVALHPGLWRVGRRRPFSRHGARSVHRQRSDPHPDADQPDPDRDAGRRTDPGQHRAAVRHLASAFHRHGGLWPRYPRAPWSRRPRNAADNITPAVQPGSDRPQLPQAAGFPDFIFPSLLLGLTFSGFHGFTALLPFILIDDLGLTPFQFAMALLVQTASFISGNLVVSYLSTRISGARLVEIALVLLAISGLGFAVLPQLFPGSVLAIMAPVGIWMLALAFISPSTTAAAMSGFGAIAGAAGAMTGFFQVGGGFVGSLTAGTLFPDARTALVVQLPSIAILAIGVALIDRRRRR
ncbi:multidrug effflux MFS transporter [Devosia chinhatensis]|uniref:Multidrug effflux MFS transporter n=1 Tax=Devosia aurantiaca TaxID=2714858 RepID=A0A6M1SWE6_9HYPH|nr:multidrug effflux MFS transporter [Devosia aurantiaca]